MDQDLRWLIGIGVSTALALAGMLVAAFRNLTARISKNSSELHGRIDDVKDNYVRRDDLAGHLGRIEDGFRDLRREVRESNTQVLEALRNRDH